MKNLLPAFFFIFRLVPPGCWRRTDNGKTRKSHAPIAVAPDQDKQSAGFLSKNEVLLVAGLFLRKELHAEFNLSESSIRYFKIKADNGYRITGVSTLKGCKMNWAFTLKYNGSEWYNINNWTMLVFEYGDVTVSENRIDLQGKMQKLSESFLKRYFYV